MYSSTNRLIMWEDYKGEIPAENGALFQVNPETTETFILTRGMNPTEEQKQMIQDAKNRPIRFTTDCPKSSPAQLARFRRYGMVRNQQRAERAEAK